MARKKGYDRSVYQALTMITQFGITMLVPICLCAFIGGYLDWKFGTSYLFVLMFFVGALAGFRNVYLLSKKFLVNKPRGDEHHEKIKADTKNQTDK